MKTRLKYSNRVKVITLLSNLLVLIGFCLIYANRVAVYEVIIKGHIILCTIFCLLVLCMLIIPLYFMLNAPIYYVVSNEKIILKTVVGRKEFMTCDYHIDMDSTIDFYNSQRVSGSGGSFGYIGKFKLPNREICFFFLTNESGKVISLRNKDTGVCTYISR